MLRSLRVRNLALAENISVAFESGLNVITGETGAGKSMLVGALSLLLGERADKTLIRTGEEAASAEAVFELRDTADVDRVLGEVGLAPCDGGQLVLRRVVRANGGQNLVNDAPVTLQTLKQLGECLVDLHGPHDHQSLFHPEAQLAVLDAFGRLTKERRTYEEAFGGRREIAARKAELEAGGTDVEQQLDLLAYRVKEIEQAQLVAGEEETVRREHDLVGHAQRVLELTGAVVASLTDGEGAAFGGLAAVQRPMDELERLMPEAAEWRAEAAALAARTQELAENVRRAADRIEADPSRLEWLDQRLSLYQRLKKKYGGSVEAIFATLEDSRCRLQDLRTRGEQIAKLDAQWREADAEVRRLGGALGRKRRAAAAQLAEAITGELEFLGFPSSSFAIDLLEVEPQADGMDGIEFGFAPNPGEAMRPLRLIASSGEISRVMLATKAVLAQHDRIPVLVFDEIDANLGGEMGDAVGRELAGVAERHQVLCITHLPQVAVHGTTHLAVSKTVREGRTFSEVARVDGDARVGEIERMLGGRAVSDATRRHAREMLQRARRPAR